MLVSFFSQEHPSLLPLADQFASQLKYLLEEIQSGGNTHHSVACLTRMKELILFSRFLICSSSRNNLCLFQTWRSSCWDSILCLSLGPSLPCTLSQKAANPRCNSLTQAIDSIDQPSLLPSRQVYRANPSHFHLSL